jgi:hypothetical protein
MSSNAFSLFNIASLFSKSLLSSLSFYCLSVESIIHSLFVLERENGNACRVLVGKPEAKTPFGKPRRKWRGDIKMGLKETELDSME